MQKIINRGFTLIELLVVIAIIGILAGIVLASLNSARGGANDAKIKEQLSGFRTAMELYYSGAGAGTYGPVGTAADGCVATPTLIPYNRTQEGLLSLSTEGNWPAGASLACWDNRAVGTAASQWAAQARLGGGTGNFICTDDTGAVVENAASMIGSGDTRC